MFGLELFGTTSSIVMIDICLNFSRYRNGCDYMGEHRDDEVELDKDAGIASVSLGAVRDFVFRHSDARSGKKKRPSVKLALAHGSCLLMRHPTNQHWYHSLPKRKACTTVRINLTYRKIKSS